LNRPVVNDRDADTWDVQLRHPVGQPGPGLTLDDDRGDESLDLLDPVRGARAGSGGHGWTEDSPQGRDPRQPRGTREVMPIRIHAALPGHVARLGRECERMMFSGKADVG
jgi:hypothetical protein